MTNQEYNTQKRLNDLGITREMIVEFLGMKDKSVRDMLAGCRPVPRWVKSLEFVTAYAVEFTIDGTTKKIFTTGKSSLNIVSDLLRESANGSATNIKVLVKPIKK